MTVLLIGIAVFFIVYLFFAWYLIRRPKVRRYDIFASDGKWLDTIAAFSRREVERFYQDQDVFVRRHEN